VFARKASPGQAQLLSQSMSQPCDLDPFEMGKEFFQHGLAQRSCALDQVATVRLSSARQMRRSWPPARLSWFERRRQ
jgi:hypothetical protein